MHANMLHCINLLAAVLSVLPITIAIPQPPYNRSTQACRYLPGDAEWPSDADWNELNQTIGGRLIRGVPLAQPCYKLGIDSSICAEIQDNWSLQAPYLDDPVNVMNQYWLNNSCSPFLAPNGSCTLGNLAQYAINISDASSVIAGIQFAKEKNIRLVVKNTGHDVLGRSAGEGSLALWTHNLKNMTFFNYTSSHYTGPAAKFGAGVQVEEVYQAASAHGLRAVGGGCPTVGLAGGWLPGGGHGPLTSSYSLGADNSLEFEVVTTNGSHLIASPTQNSDLYWALSGGGSGNYAIVLSVTIKAYVDGPVAGSQFVFTNTDSDAYWSAIEAWAKYLLVLESTHPSLKTAVTFSNEFFELAYGTLADGTAAEMNAALAPFFQELEALNITLSSNETLETTNFAEHYEHFTDPNAFFNNETIGDRLIPRELVQDNPSELINTIRSLASNYSSSVFVFVAANVSHARVGNEPGSNSVLPAWRDALFLLNFGVTQPENATWDEAKGWQAMVNDWEDTFRAFTPGGGSYINEATFDNVNWKSDYFGENYDRLLAIKKNRDPENILWARAAVGSDALTLAADGRLCSTS